MGFDIMSLQKGRGQVQARSKADEGHAVLKYIDVEDLVPSEDNFYSMSAIDVLAGLREMTLSEQKAAVFLEDLRMYCEEMVGRYDERERWKMWENYSDALGVAIDALRR